jgi:hypothetical protein
MMQVFYLIFEIISPMAKYPIMVFRIKNIKL